MSNRVSYKQHQKLKKRLKITVFGSLVTLVLLVLGITFFGPQIGAVFGFISKHKDDTGIQPLKAISPPIFKNLPEATKTKELSIEGYADSGSTIKIYINGPEKGETLADGEGTFIFENLELIKGRNTIFAKAYGDKGVESVKSATKTVVYDKSSPKLEIEEPKDGDTIRNLNNRINIKGTINEVAELKINDKTAVVKPNNSFEFLLGVEEGNVKIVIVATDKAGNEKKEELMVKYKKDSN